MDAFVGEYQYVIAWSTYVVAGLVFLAFWWHLTGAIRHTGWRDLLRGLMLVMIYTPWFTSETHEFMAPALMIVGMELLLGSTSNGLAGSLVLLVASALVLVALIVRRFLGGRRG